MARKALCIGIDDYPGLLGTLRGCINDARAWARLLTDHYDFAPSDVQLQCDERATRRALLAGLDRLLGGARAGDVFVVTNSSHGTYVPDGDATYDEALCPYDYRSNLVLDDEIRERFGNVASGARLVFVSDSCHAATAPRCAPARGYRRARFLAPEDWGGASVSGLSRMHPRRTAIATPDSNAILLAACRPNQRAFDAEFGATCHGAMTWYALQAIRERDYDLSYADLQARLVALMGDAGFAQHPELEGSAAGCRRRLFA